MALAPPINPDSFNTHSNAGLEYGSAFNINRRREEENLTQK
jgi:hypothetical protein